jgi:hypothetical protein
MAAACIEGGLYGSPEFEPAYQAAISGEEPAAHGKPSKYLAVVL